MHIVDERTLSYTGTDEERVTSDETEFGQKLAETLSFLKELQILQLTCTRLLEVDVPSKGPGRSKSTTYSDYAVVQLNDILIDTFPLLWERADAIASLISLPRIDLGMEPLAPKTVKNIIAQK